MIQSAKPHTLVINEIFHSIQGESTHAGRPCVFVRLTYCNLRCTYCDTEYSFYEGKEMPFEEILAAIRQFECPLVEVTGGEPLVQTNVIPFLALLCDEGYDVLLETGGSLDISPVDTRVKRIVDLKTPSSGMLKKNYWKNVEQLKAGDEVKFVIGDRQDYEWSREQVRAHDLPKRCPVLFSPVYGRLEPVTLAQWILEDKLDVRFQIQMHKIIWHPEERGV